MNWPGIVFAFWRVRGKSAAFDPSRDKALAERGFSEEEIERGGYLLDIYKRDFWSDARHGKTVREAGRVLGQDEISSLVYMELRRIQMEGKSVALSASLNPDDDRLGDALIGVIMMADIGEQNAVAGFVINDPEIQACSHRSEIRILGNLDPVH